jgi:hypothetical protein
MSTNDARKMLTAGRRRPAHVATVPDTAQPPQTEDAEPTRRPVDQAQNPPSAYVKVSAFVTPEQRVWINTVAAQTKLDGIEGISASDVVRLALSHLHADYGTEDGTALLGLLIDQAHVEAEHFPGRKNRGLPKRR